MSINNLELFNKGKSSQILAQCKLSQEEINSLFPQLLDLFKSIPPKKSEASEEPESNDAQSLQIAFAFKNNDLLTLKKLLEEALRLKNFKVFQHFWESAFQYKNYEFLEDMIRIATKHGDIRIVSAILEQNLTEGMKIDVNSKDPLDGKTALYLAVEAGSVEHLIIARLLLFSGADPTLSITGSPKAISDDTSILDNTSSKDNSLIIELDSKVEQESIEQTALMLSIKNKATDQKNGKYFVLIFNLFTQLIIEFDSDEKHEHNISKTIRDRTLKYVKPFFAYIHKRHESINGELNKTFTQLASVCLQDTSLSLNIKFMTCLTASSLSHLQIHLKNIATYMFMLKKVKEKFDREEIIPMSCLAVIIESINNKIEMMGLLDKLQNEMLDLIETHVDEDSNPIIRMRIKTALYSARREILRFYQLILNLACRGFGYIIGKQFFDAIELDSRKFAVFLHKHGDVLYEERIAKIKEFQQSLFKSFAGITKTLDKLDLQTLVKKNSKLNNPQFEILNSNELNAQLLARIFIKLFKQVCSEYLTSTNASTYLASKGKRVEILLPAIMSFIMESFINFLRKRATASRNLAPSTLSGLQDNFRHVNSEYTAQTIAELIPDFKTALTEEEKAWQERELREEQEYRAQQDKEYQEEQARRAQRKLAREQLAELGKQRQQSEQHAKSEAKRKEELVQSIFQHLIPIEKNKKYIVFIKAILDPKTKKMDLHHFLSLMKHIKIDGHKEIKPDNKHIKEVSITFTLGKKSLTMEPRHKQHDRSEEVDPNCITKFREMLVEIGLENEKIFEEQLKSYSEILAAIPVKKDLTDNDNENQLISTNSVSLPVPVLFSISSNDSLNSTQSNNANNRLLTMSNNTSRKRFKRK